MSMKRDYDSCVQKRRWDTYKTCYECGTFKRCKYEKKPNWFGRIIEAITVGVYQLLINRRLKKIFGHASKKSVRRWRDAMRRAQAEEARRDQERQEQKIQKLNALQDRDIELDGERGDNV